jgi:hypothetical protein
LFIKSKKIISEEIFINNIDHWSEQQLGDKKNTTQA